MVNGVSSDAEHNCKHIVEGGAACMGLGVDRDSSGLAVDEEFPNQFGGFTINNVGEPIDSTGSQVSGSNFAVLPPIL